VALAKSSPFASLRITISECYFFMQQDCVTPHAL
jgi:hypothetical protein